MRKVTAPPTTLRAFATGAKPEPLKQRKRPPMSARHPHGNLGAYLHPKKKR